MYSVLKNKLKDFLALRKQEEKIASYIKNGRIPWSTGYHEHKIDQIKKMISPTISLVDLNGYGLGIDERIVEYPWILSKLSQQESRLLDAGSTLNHEFILLHPILRKKHLTICTFEPEALSLTKNRINYIYEDLRLLPMRDQWFDEVVCISTLEHIDMDNSMYGYKLPNSGFSEVKSYEYLKVVNELLRVLKPGGKLLITVPFGRFENHGFFQQFDSEMMLRMVNVLKLQGTCELTFFRYTFQGWIKADQEGCSMEESFNPHTGKGQGTDGAAHSRAIGCIEFNKIV